jgi:hypothetical protein
MLETPGRSYWLSNAISGQDDSSKLKAVSRRGIGVSDPALKTGETNLFSGMSGGVVVADVINGGNDP